MIPLQILWSRTWSLMSEPLSSNPGFPNYYFCSLGCPTEPLHVIVSSSRFIFNVHAVSLLSEFSLDEVMPETKKPRISGLLDTV